MLRRENNLERMRATGYVKALAGQGCGGETAEWG